MTTDVNVTRCGQILKANLLVVLTFVGAAVGFGIRIGVRQYSPSDETLMWIGILGEMYLNMLKMMIVPLVVCSVISGTASLDPRSNGKISVVSLSFIMISNFIPCLIGALVCLTIKPGSISRDVPVDAAGQTNIGTQDIFADLLRNLFPDNLIAATFQKRQTEYTTARQLYNSTLNGTITTKIHTVVIDKKVGVAPSTNILGLLIASCMFGIATGAAKEVGRPFASFFYSATEIILLVMGKVIWTTPVGVASLIGKTLASTQNLEDDFSRLGLFIGTVMIGLAILTFICVPLTYFITTRSKPFKFMLTMLQPGMIVMATASTDRMRSTTNVYVQGLCGVVTDRICRSSLNNMEEKTQTTKDIAVVQEENKLPLGQKSDHQIQNNVTMYTEKL